MVEEGRTIDRSLFLREISRSVGREGGRWRWDGAGGKKDDRRVQIVDRLISVGSPGRSIGEFVAEYNFCRIQKSYDNWPPQSGFDGRAGRESQQEEEQRQPDRGLIRCRGRGSAMRSRISL